MSDVYKTQVLTADPNRTQLGAPPTLADPNKTVMGAAPSLSLTQTIKPVQCPVCKTFNPAGVMFCVDCGLIFERSLEGDAFGAPAVQLPVLIDETGREHHVRPGDNSIGRDGDILLSDGRISRRHAQISNRDGQVTVEDLGSTNGTKIDNQPLAAGEKRVLKGGESVSLGGLILRFQLPGAKGGNATQVFASNKTAAIPTAPRKEVAPATLVGEGKEQPLKAGVTSFGRKAENDIQVVDPYISGKHGQIEITDQGAFLTDLGSSNGTYLNGAKLAANMRTLVTPEDVIRLGSLEFQIRINPPETA